MRSLLCMAALFFASTAYAAAPEENQSFMQKFNAEMAALGGKAKLTGKQTMTIASAVYCVVQKAGLKQTMAFYEDIKQVQSQAHALCRSKQEAAAKNYVLGQYIPRKDEPIVQFTLACYEQHQDSIAALIRDPNKAARLPDYYRWAKNPALARAEMDPQQLCH